MEHHGAHRHGRRGCRPHRGVDPLYPSTSSVGHRALRQVVLAVVLFVDATEVEGGFFGKEPKLTARLLLIALPLSLSSPWRSER